MATWDGTFETIPSDTEDISLGDDRIRSLKTEVRDRMETEHRFGTFVTSEDDGRHRPGSARIFHGNTAPVAIEAADRNGSTDLDAGRLWHDPDTGRLYVYNGTAWVPAVWGLAGDPTNNQLDIVGGAQFVKAGADPMDIHAHAARHLATGADWLPFLIAGVRATHGQTTTTWTAPQTLASLTLDLSGANSRGSASRVLLVASVVFEGLSGGGGTRWEVIFQEGGTAVQTSGLPIGPAVFRTADGNNNETVALFAYLDSVSDGASHTYDLVVSRTEGSMGATARNQMFLLIDLGRS